MQGKIIGGRYKIIEKLGGGAFGQTYRAEDIQLPGNPHCVVKQLKPQRTDPLTLETAKRLFNSEAQVLHKLGNHDQIPRLYAYFEEDGEFYLVQELIEGVPLSEEILPGKPWREGQVINLLQQILSVLDFVHQQNAIHRDIKPSNLMRRVDGQLIAIDFGAVKQISSQAIAPSGDSKLTVAVSTYGYTPPEQMQGYPRCCSDIYALGMTAIQAVTGILPHKLTRDNRTGDIIWRPDARVSDGLAAILDKMVDGRLAERYQSAKEVLHDIRQLTQTTTGSTAVATTVVSGGNNVPTIPSTVANVSQTTVQPNSTVYQRNNSAGTTSPSPPTKNNKFFKPWYLLAILPGIAVLLGIIELLFPIVRPTYYVGQGRELMEMERYEEALEKFEKASDIKANSVEAWNGIGNAYYALARETRAMEAYDRALKINPNDAETLNDKGRLLYEKDRDAEALKSYEKALESEPENADAWYGKGIAYIGLGRYNEAIKAFDNAREYAPDKPAVWYIKAQVLQSLGREEEAINIYNEAIATYDDILKENPNDIKAYLDRGGVLSQLRRFQDALDSYNKALEINPDFYRAWLQKSTVLMNMRRFDEALEASDKALELRPNSYLAWHNRGTLFAIGMANKQGNTQEQRKEYLQKALESYQKAVELRPSFHDAWRDRGAVLGELQRFDEALESFDRSLKIKPDDYKSWTSKGITLNALKRNQEALAAFDKAMIINQNDFFVWFSRGITLEQLGRKQEAIISYERSIEIKPDFQQAREALKRLRGR